MKTSPARFVGVVLTMLICGRALAAEISSGGDATNRVGESVLLLKSGQGRLMSYGLYCLTSNSLAGSSARMGGDLILILRNTSAKYINLQDVTARSFALHDAQGSEIKLYLRSTPIGMSFGQTEVLHLWVDSLKDAAEPWSLTFSSTDGGSLTITGIEPSKAVPK